VQELFEVVIAQAGFTAQVVDQSAPFRRVPIRQRPIYMLLELFKKGPVRIFV
jgi:hypothetical protein